MCLLFFKQVLVSIAFSLSHHLNNKHIFFPFLKGKGKERNFTCVSDEPDLYSKGEEKSVQLVHLLALAPFEQLSGCR